MISSGPAGPPAVSAPSPRARLAYLQDLALRTESFQERRRAARTRKAYAADWQDFASWCAGVGLPALPAAPETVGLYLTALADRCAVKTLERRLVAIAAYHQDADIDPPTRDRFVRRTMSGIRRSLGVAGNPKEPLRTEHLRRALGALPSATLVGVRDRALLLLGFAGAFRRSELVALDREDLAFTPEGLRVRLRWSKTDQEGEGAALGIAFGRFPDTCPVAAVRAWLTVLDAYDDRPQLFRALGKGGRVLPHRLSDKQVARVVKRAAAAAGLDPERFAGHSLRSGMATSAAAGGAQERDIMRHTRHKSAEMVRRYIRDGELFHPGNATRFTGL